MNNKTKLKKIIGLLILSFVLFLGVFYFSPVLAQTNDTLGVTAVDENISLGGGDLRVTIVKIIRAVLGLLGLVAVVIVIYGGFTFMTAGGDDEKVGRGKKILINGIIGLVIILSSFIIVQFLINKLSEATGLGKINKPFCQNVADALKDPTDCGEDIVLPDICESKHFVVSSVTPVTDATNMNNVAVRVIFSRRINNNIPLNEIVTIKNGGTIINDFEFVQKDNSNFENTLIEAQYVGTNTCADANNTKCLPAGIYNININPNVQDQNGNVLEIKTDCGDYPLDGQFTVNIGSSPAGVEDNTNNNLNLENLLYFNGASGFIQSNSPVSFDNIGLSVWIKPELSFLSGEFNDVYTIVQMDDTVESGRYNLYLANLPDSESQNEDKIYLFWEYGVEGKSRYIDIGNRNDLNSKWTNIIVNHDRSNGQCQIFVNGILMDTLGIADDDNIGVSGKRLNIGGADLIPDDGFSGAVARFFPGYISNLYVYNANLSSELINNLYYNGQGLTAYNWGDADIHLALNDSSVTNILNDGKNNVTFDGFGFGAVWGGTAVPDEENNEVVNNVNLVIDNTPPSVSRVKLKNGADLNNQYLVAGNVYSFYTDIVDKVGTMDGGVGYVYMNLKKSGSISSGYNFFAGPSVIDKSKTIDSKPYTFEYKRLLIPSNATPLDEYILTLDVYDHDNNHTVVTSTFTVIASHCNNNIQDGDELGVDVGGSCGSIGYCIKDSDCAPTYRCIDSAEPGTGDYTTKTCQPFPFIQDVDPMDGGTGNWISILGKNFGSYLDNSVTGTIEFGIQNDNDIITEWKKANIVSCDVDGNTWQDQWIVVEVPDDTVLPIDSLSAIRLTTARKIQIAGEYKNLQDTTINDWGDKPGPKERAGWFLKNTVLRPGLCKVVNENASYLNAPLGMPRDTVKAIGKGFTDTKGSIYFSTVQSNVRSWTDSVVRSSVPNLEAGVVPVYVQVGDEKSNKVPFEIVTSDQIKEPVITLIDPATTTPGSYITLVGRNFGNTKGNVYFSNEKGGAKCGETNSGCTAISPDMPLFCGNTWSDNQIIVKVPEDIVFKAVTSTQEVGSQVYIKKGIPGKTGTDGGYYVIPDPDGLYSLKEGSIFNIHFTLDDIEDNSLYQFNSGTNTILKYRYILNKYSSTNWQDGSYSIEVVEHKTVEEPHSIVRRNLMVIYFDPITKMAKPINLSLPISTNDYTVGISVVNGEIKIEANGQSTKVKVNFTENLNSTPLILGTRFESTNANVIKSWGLFGEIKSISFNDDDLLVENKIFEEVVNTLDFIKNFVTVKNITTNLYSSGENNFEVYDDASLPSICSITPEAGPAPRDNVTLKGINFSNDPATDPTVYFYTENSEIQSRESTIGWLFTPFSDFLINLYNDGEGQGIDTPIPYDENYGYSMMTGMSPIKIKDNLNRFSNSVYYNVQDCRMNNSVAPGYQCCNEGPEAGRIKSILYGCKGEDKNAGYVWRFTTGLLPDQPYVVQSCDEANWETTLEFPSPTPSEQWSSGKNVCVNSVLAVRFGPENMPMSSASINSDSVKVYKCGNGEDNPNFDVDKCEKTNIIAEGSCRSEVGCIFLENNILKIYIPPENYTFDTWYHVELMSSIESEQPFTELGVKKIKKENLRIDRPMDNPVNRGDIVAFNFNFKTGSEKCILAGATMNPFAHTTKLLGIVQNPKYNFVYGFNEIFNINRVRPYYYYLDGKANQVCNMIDVNKMGWKWGTSDQSKATAERAPSKGGEKPFYVDSRGVVTAWMNTNPNVWILASTTVSSDASILLSANTKRGNPGVTGQNTGYYIVNDNTGNYVLRNGFSYQIDFTLDNVSDDKYSTSTDSTDQKIYKNRVLINKGFTLWTNKESEDWYEKNGEEAFYQFYSAGSYYLGISETKIKNYTSSGEFVSTSLQRRQAVLWYADSIDNATGLKLDLSTTTNDYSLKLSVDNGKVSISDGNNSVTQSYNLAQFNNQPLLVGTGSTSTEGNNFYGLYGKFNKLEFFDSGSENVEVINATSSLVIDLSNPKVVEYWPNCIEACINTQIGVSFNMLMVTSTYKESGAVELYECNNEEKCVCVDENCDSSSLKLLPISVGDDSDPNILKFYPAANDTDKVGILKANTWYLVRLKDSIKSIGGFRNGDVNQPIVGESLEEFSWKFKTKNDTTPCLAESVDILPNPLYAYYVGEKDKIQAQPNGAPDACSPYGQALNPWFFTWDWSSFNSDVFTISNFSTSNSLNPYCGRNCLYKGSDIARSDSSVYICGNGIVDPGEDCDIAKIGEEAGKSCTYNCLRPGSAGATCGNGVVDLGEECDPGIATEKPYCTNNCLWQGSSNVFSSAQGVAYCGSGSVTPGEDCDIASNATDNTGKIGCTTNCLHEGTPLSQAWCDQSGHENISVCQDAKAVSVCGNHIIETGEECEIGENGATEKTCDNNCLLFNVCESSLKQCNKGEEGCNNDCTLAGSSALYSESSVCGDGLPAGIGEYSACEVATSTLISQYGTTTLDKLAQSPVQITTAIGQYTSVSEIPGLSIKGQMSTSSAVTIGYFDTDGDIVSLSEDYTKTGLGNYYLVCGYNEFDKKNADGEYNLCPDNKNNEKGVAVNSCCYNRPKRVDSYPLDSEGLLGDTGVCRNTYVEAVVDGYLDPQTVNNSDFALIFGSDDKNYLCASINAQSIDVTEIVNEILNVDDKAQISFIDRLFSSIWNGIKTFFARLFGLETKALTSSYDLNEVQNKKVWCTLPNYLSFRIANDLNTTTTVFKGEERVAVVSATSTISAYLNDALAEDTTYGVLLLGGNRGIRDKNGVSIKNATNPSRNDVWFFKTGSQICKITEINLSPNSYLFDAPNTSADFDVMAISIDNKTKKENKIVSTPAYTWEWSWGPNNHKVFDIPQTANPYNNISVSNVEGTTTAVAKAVVTQDVDTTNNQRGLFFADSSDLTAMFCENPWPAKKADGTWEPYKGQYNFSFSYCADDGVSGDRDDDLPFFKFRDVTTQYTIKKCEIGGELCDEDLDCSVYWNLPYNNGTSSPYGIFCETMSYEKLLNNECKLLEADPYSMKYCHRQDNIYPPLYGEEYKLCTDDSNCNIENGEICSYFSSTWKVRVNDNTDPSSYPNRCLLAPTNATPVTADTIQRIIAFADNTDDVFGFQIFENKNGLDALNWYKEKFPNSSPQSTEIAGYPAIQDGNNYYISAKNFVKKGNDYDLWNNIYSFSINEGASDDSKNVLTQILDSLQFNLNVSDYGYCLADSVLNNTKLSMSEDEQKMLNENGLTCTNDFDCRDTNGQPLSGTNGVCSNAKTKFFRDVDRVKRIAEVQSSLSNYFDTYWNSYDFKGSLKGGTYIPGYTVSVWPSWNDTLADAVLNKTSLPQDNINTWTACTDSEAESQTCWNAKTLTYSCPAYSSVFEYEFVSNTPSGRPSFVLHAPLEFLHVNSHFVKEQGININTFTTDPYCQNNKLTLQPGVCGDGVIQPGEECDPPGSNKISTEGYQLTEMGKCSENQKVLCTENEDCEVSIFTNYNKLEEIKVLLNSDTKICQTLGKAIIYDNVNIGDNNIRNVFVCNTDEDCGLPSTFNGIPDIKTFGPELLHTWTGYAYISGNTVNPISPFICSSLSSSTYFGGLENEGSCEGFSAAGIRICPENQSAVSTCSSDCKWGYDVCQSKTFCGNGIVESGEACDDGKALNGKYGQCNTACSGLSEQYCGNGTQDANLELCENIGEKSYAVYKGAVRYCKHNPGIRCTLDNHCPNYDSGIEGLAVGTSRPDICASFEGTTLLENANNSLLNCNTNSPLCLYFGLNNNFAIKNYIGYCEQNKKVLCNDNSGCSVPRDFNSYIFTSEDFDSEDWLSKFTTDTIDVGPCLINKGKIGSSYNFNKENSCSWDCQRYGEYCGDGVKNGDEECDDGNTINEDSCDNNCRTVAKPVVIVCGDGRVEGIEKCDPGKYCENLIKPPCTTDSDCNGVGDGLCKVRDGGMGTDSEGTYTCSADCRVRTPYVAGCGNGILDDKEVCDGGVKNGQVCVLEYGKSCTYCSNDCTKVFTKDSPNYCGNGKIDLIDPKTKTYEVCDRKSDGTVIENDTANSNNPAGTPKNCPDKGNYTCTDCTKTPGNECYRCEDGYSIPQLSLINVTGQEDGNDEYKIRFWRIDTEGSSGINQTKEISSTTISVYNSIFTLDLDGGVYLNDECKDEYKFFFSDANDNTTDDITKGDVFEFPKPGTNDPIYNDFIFSPAVPEGVFRVVVAWTNNGYDFIPDVKIYNNDFSNITPNQETVIGILDDLENLELCDSNNYKEECYSIRNSGILYFHEIVERGNLKFQSVTIDTRSNSSVNSNYKVFIGNFNNDEEIGSLKDTDIKVYVYGHHDGQADYSIYNPINTFEINKSAGNIDSSYRYWHVFDLRNSQNDVYSLASLGVGKENGEIKSSFAEIVDSSIYTGFYESSMLAFKFDWPAYFWYDYIDNKIFEETSVANLFQIYAEEDDGTINQIKDQTLIYNNYRDYGDLSLNKLFLSDPNDIWNIVEYNNCKNYGESSCIVKLDKNLNDDNPLPLQLVEGQIDLISANENNNTSIKSIFDSLSGKYRNGNSYALAMNTQKIYMNLSLLQNGVTYKVVMKLNSDVKPNKLGYDENIWKDYSNAEYFDNYLDEDRNRCKKDLNGYFTYAYNLFVDQVTRDCEIRMANNPLDICYPPEKLKCADMNISPRYSDKTLDILDKDEYFRDFSLSYLQEFYIDGALSGTKTKNFLSNSEFGGIKLNSASSNNLNYNKIELFSLVKNGDTITMTPINRFTYEP